MQTKSDTENGGAQLGKAPVRFLRNLVELVADEEGLQPKTVLRGTKVPLRALEDDDQWLDFDAQVRIYERVAALSTLPGIGFRSPSARSFADQGILGSLVMSAPNIREAFETLARYVSVLGSMVSYHPGQSGANFVLETHDVVRLSPAAHRLVTEENLATWKYTALPVPGLEQYLLQVQIDYPRPRHWRMYEALFGPGVVRFGARRTAAILSRKVERLTMPSANPETYALLLNECDARMARAQPTLRSLVLQALQELPPARWQVDALAAQLQLSPRTLSRRLRMEGTQPRRLIDEHRLHLAGRRIEEGQRDDRIAAELGYASTASFRRAYRRLAGRSTTSTRRA